MWHRRFSAQPYVLFYGVEQERWIELKLDQQNQLRVRKIPTSFCSGHALTPEEALEHISERGDLEIVYLCAEAGACRLRQDVGRFVRDIAAHPRKPWVVLDPRLPYILALVFEREGVMVFQTELAEAIIRRHNFCIELEIARGRHTPYVGRDPVVFRSPL